GRQRAGLPLACGGAGPALMRCLTADGGWRAGDGRRAGTATEDRVARFRAVAPQAIVASRVARHVVARVGRLVARVCGAAHPAVAVGSRAGSTGATDAGFSAIAEETVVALRIGGAAAPQVDDDRHGHVVRAWTRPDCRCSEAAGELLIDFDEVDSR